MSRSEIKIEVYNFNPKKIFTHGNKIKNDFERRDYYEKVLDKHIHNVQILDESKYYPEIDLDSALRKEIEKIKIMKDDKNEHEEVKIDLLQNKKSFVSFDKEEPKKIDDLRNKIRSIIRKKGEGNKEKILELQQKDRYEFVKKLLMESYPNLSEEQFLCSKESLKRYLKEGMLQEID